MNEHQKGVLHEVLPQLDKAFLKLSTSQRKALNEALSAFLEVAENRRCGESINWWTAARWICELVLRGRSLGAVNQEPTIRELILDLQRVTQDLSLVEPTLKAEIGSESNFAPVKIAEAAKITSAYVQRHLKLLSELFPPSLCAFASHLFLSLNDESTGQLSTKNFLATRFEVGAAHEVLGDTSPFDSISAQLPPYDLEWRYIAAKKNHQALHGGFISIADLFSDTNRYLNRTERQIYGFSLQQEVRGGFARHDLSLLKDGSTLSKILKNGYLPLPYAKPLSVEDLVRTQLGCLGMIGVARNDVKTAADGKFLSPTFLFEHDVNHLADDQESTVLVEKLIQPKEKEVLSPESLTFIARLAHSANIVPIYLKGCVAAKAHSPEVNDAYQILWLQFNHELLSFNKVLRINFFQRFIEGDESCRSHFPCASRIKNPLDIGGGISSTLATLSEVRIQTLLSTAWDCLRSALK